MAKRSRRNSPGYYTQYTQLLDSRGKLVCSSSDKKLPARLLGVLVGGFRDASPVVVVAYDHRSRPVLCTKGQLPADTIVGMFTVQVDKIGDEAGLVDFGQTIECVRSDRDHRIPPAPHVSQERFVERGQTA